MKFDFQLLKKHHALAILGWRYSAPYDLYNFEPEQRQVDLDYLLNPQNGFFAILKGEGELAGFCSFGPDGQVPGGNYSNPALDIGMGIRPDLTGQGNGRRYAQAVARYGAQRYQMQALRVTIESPTTLCGFRFKTRNACATIGPTPYPKPR